MLVPPRTLAVLLCALPVALACAGTEPSDPAPETPEMPDLVYAEHDPATFSWTLHAYSEGEGSRELAPGPSALPRPYSDLLHVRPTTGELLYSSTDSSGNDQHYVLLNPATGEFRRLALPGEVQDWSPSGDLLTTYSGGDHLIVTLEGAIRMTICGSSDDCGVPEWEPGSDAVVVFRRPDGGKADLWRVPVTGEAEVNLTLSPATEEVGASYSPTGQHLVYLRQWTDLVVMNDDGTGARQLMSPVGIGEFPWSPDGLSVAVNGTLEGNTGLVVVPLQGPAQPVTPPGETLYVPSHIGWSPDGSRLLYSAFDGAADDNVGLYLINLDGSGRRRVNRPGTDAYAAAWIPDVP